MLTASLKMCFAMLYLEIRECMLVLFALIRLHVDIGCLHVDLNASNCHACVRFTRILEHASVSVICNV